MGDVMETNLIPFVFESRTVRVIMVENEPWFVAKDISEALEYSESSNAARLFSHVPDEWRGMNPIHTLGGTQEMLTVSEQGMYFFIVRSDKPKALPFQKWAAGDVFPSIRKTGKYEVKKEIKDVDELETLGKMILALSEERKRVRKLEEESKKTIERLDQIETATDHFTVIGYMRYTKSKSIDLPTAAKLGSKMTRYCKQHEIAMGNVPDPRFGMVHTYPKWAIEKVLN